MGLIRESEIEALKARAERMEEALERIERWGDAYPEEMFPEPDLKRARELLKAGGMTLDSVAGHCMRHVATRMAEIARAALDPTPDPSPRGGEGIKK